MTPTSPPVVFRSADAPAVPDGRYRVTVSQQVHGVPDDGGAPTTYTGVLELTVQGPRFTIPPSDVVRLHPPRDSGGPYHGVVPHVVLSRSTLPWERRPPSPWPALLLFTEREWAGVTQLTQTLPRDLEPGQNQDDPVAVVELDAALSAALAPSEAERRLLCHVRAGELVDAGAVVLANRAVQGGQRHVACLISTEPVTDVGLPAPPAGRARHLLLLSWSFTSEREHPDLNAACRKLDRGDAAAPRLTVAGAGAGGIAVERLDRGYVPVPHRRTDGGQEPCWYRGPLAPWDRPVPAPVDDPADPAGVPAAATTGDDLAMTDITYPAARELGRMLGLADRELGPRLAAWRRARRHADARAASDQHVAPRFDDVASAPPPDVTWLREQSLLARLARLEGVPYRYLVPDPRLLPAGQDLTAPAAAATGALRLFRVDPVWVRALWNGAFSIGRTHAADIELDRGGVAELAPPAGSRCGFLLRAPWVADATLQAEAVVDGATSAPVRLDRVAADLLLGLFDGTSMSSLSLHMPHEELHYGLDGSGPTWTDADGHPMRLRAGDVAPDVLDLAQESRTSDRFGMSLLHPPRWFTFRLPEAAR